MEIAGQDRGQDPSRSQSQAPASTAARPLPEIKEGGATAARPSLAIDYLHVRDGLFELGIVEVEVEALPGDEIVVASLLDDLALVHDQDLVGVADGGGGMGDDGGRAGRYWR